MLELANYLLFVKLLIIIVNLDLLQKMMLKVIALNALMILNLLKHLHHLELVKQFHLYVQIIITLNWQIHQIVILEIVYLKVFV